jgi:hypothetical protein
MKGIWRGFAETATILKNALSYRTMSSTTGSSFIGYLNPSIRASRVPNRGVD